MKECKAYALEFTMSFSASVKKADGVGTPSAVIDRSDSEK